MNRRGFTTGRSIHSLCASGESAYEKNRAPNDYRSALLRTQLIPRLGDSFSTAQAFMNPQSAFMHDVAARTHRPHQPSMLNHFWLPAWLITTALGGTALFSGSSVSLWIFCAVGATFIQCWALLITSRGFCVPMIPVLIVNILMTLGYVLWPHLANVATVSAKLPPDQHQLRVALVVSLTFTTALTLGAVVIPSRSLDLRQHRVSLREGNLFWFAMAILALRLLGEGKTILRSGDYLGYGGPTWAISIGTALTPIGILCFAYCRFAASRYRLMTLLGILAFALILFGGATRQLALIPPLVLVGYLFAGRRLASWRTRVPVILGTATATLLLAQLVISLRANPGGVGILTLIGVLWHSPGQVASNFLPEQTLGNILFSTPLTGRVSLLNLPRRAFWTSVNPLPGSMTEWPTIAPRQRLNVFTPYSGLGELGAQGSFYVAIYGAAAGAVFSFATRLVFSFPAAWRVGGNLALLSLASVFSITILQYNLRTGTRLLWYTLGLIMFLLLVVATKRSLLTSAGPSRSHETRSGTTISSPPQT